MVVVLVEQALWRVHCERVFWAAFRVRSLLAISFSNLFTVSYLLSRFLFSHPVYFGCLGSQTIPPFRRAHIQTLFFVQTPLTIIVTACSESYMLLIYRLPCPIHRIDSNAVVTIRDKPLVTPNRDPLVCGVDVGSSTSYSFTVSCHICFVE